MDTMLNEPNPQGDTRLALSALMDSELDRDDLPGLMGHWQQDADSRAAWHCYHLIGDVMRSDDLALPGGRDAAMLQALRLRLADEPVPLAPRALADLGSGDARPGDASTAARPVSRGWLGRLGRPAAATAAGFVVVAGVLVVLRQNPPPAADGAALAQAGTVAQPVVHTPAGALVRDAGLDRYLQAHRKLANSPAAVGAADQRVQIVYESK